LAKALSLPKTGQNAFSKGRFFQKNWQLFGAARKIATAFPVLTADNESSVTFAVAQGVEVHAAPMPAQPAAVRGSSCRVGKSFLEKSPRLQVAGGLQSFHRHRVERLLRDLRILQGKRDLAFATP